jgi:ATP-binding cassette subfamily B protein
MPENSLLKNSLFRLWAHFSERRKRQFFFLLVLMVISSLIDMLSIGSVIPFLSILTNPDKFSSGNFAYFFVKVFKVQDLSQLMYIVTLTFCFFAFFSGLFRLILLKLTIRTSFATGADMSCAIYERTLYQPYMTHISRNSSEIINGISSKTNQIIYFVIVPTLTIISSLFLLVVVISFLIYVDPFVSLIAIISFGTLYIFIASRTKNKKIMNSHVIAIQSTKIIKCLKEGLGGIRDVLIDGSQAIYLRSYSQSDSLLRKAQAGNQFVTYSPKFIIESSGMILIALLALYLFSRGSSQYNVIPSLGILALGAQRLLPAMQQAYAALSSIQGNLRSLHDTLDLLDQNIPTHYTSSNQTILSFKHQNKFKNVSFLYPKISRHVVSNVSFTINRGDKFGIIGATGSGKSTLVDILMGLLEPSIGELSVDKKIINHKNIRAWQRHIAHVPQSIFLSDTTIAENIAFGDDPKNIDWDRIHDAAEKAQLNEVISNLPNGLNTVVGEFGIRFSGGQRQRIGIARALYKNADVLIFDEATSALDDQTESSVMKAINSLGAEITVIIIAHRLTTLKKCTKIIELVDGKIVKLDNYKNIINSLN